MGVRKVSEEPSLQMLSDLFTYLFHVLRKKKKVKTKDVRRRVFLVVPEHLAFIHLASVS